MEYIIVAMLAAVIVLLIVLLARQGKGNSSGIEQKIDGLGEKTAELSRSLGSEFERSRREMQAGQQYMRAETAEKLSEMSGKIEKLRLDNAEQAGKSEKVLIESLNAIRLNNIEQNEKQSRAVTEAVERMRESNEKKLEQMRLTVDEKLTSTLSQRLDSSFKTVSDRLENVPRRDERAFKRRDRQCHNAQSGFNKCQGEGNMG